MVSNPKLSTQLTTYKQGVTGIKLSYVYVCVLSTLVVKQQPTTSEIKMTVEMVVDHAFNSDTIVDRWVKYVMLKPFH